MNPPSAWGALVFLTIPGLLVCARLLQRVRERGGRVQTAMFSWPDVVLALSICGFFTFSTIAAGLLPHGEGTAEIHTPTEKALLFNIAIFLVFVSFIWASLAVRKASPATALGLRGWPLWRALPIGALIVCAIFPMFALVMQFIHFLAPQVIEEQEVVTMFRATQQAGNHRMLAALIFIAVVFQPIVEEVLFRGYFYGVFKGWAGATASAVFTATLFAAIHGNIAALVPLLLLALAFTLAYEWSGSLLVPIGMHMTFNGVQLAILTWAPQLIDR